jgi:hypothetical protein
MVYNKSPPDVANPHQSQQNPREKNQNTYATYERTMFVAANDNICSTEITFVAEVRQNISLMCLQQNTHAFAIC